MNNRNNKSKRQSKLKHTVFQQRLGINSPAKFSTTTALSSGCCPKQPPNISFHHLQKKKQNQIKGQYYSIVGKENKGRIMNSGTQQKQQVLYNDRLREKRNTHHLISYQTTHSKLLEVKRPLISTNYESLNNQQTLKSLHKSKPHTRIPITLGSMKSTKGKLLKQTDKQNRVQRNQRLLKKQTKQRSSYAPQADQCHLKCFQNLSSQSIAHSKVSTNYFAEITSLDESQIIGTNLVIKLVEKQRSIQAKKRFNRSPQISSAKTILQAKPYKTPQQQIAEFQKMINEINTNFQQSSLIHMQNKDLQFVRSKNLNCYLGNQMHLDWKKRAMVINWMIDVLAEIGGKRETLANAVNIFDRYLSLTLNIPLDHVQCTAVASLMISAKLQDKSLTASYLSQTTLNKYSTQEIMQQEYKIFQTLNFEVNIPTLNSWANRLAVQWDIYLERVDLQQYDIIMSNLNMIKFKNSDQTSYYNYRWLCQYVDFSIMDIYTLRYQPRMLSLAFIYLILTLRLNLTTKEKVISVYPNSSQFLFEKSVFHQFFSNFLRDSFGQELIDLLPMIQYCATFVILPLRFGLPEIIPQSNIENQQEQVNYEHFCSYQTKNQQTLSSLYSRNRSIY